MPARALRPCATPGCPGKALNGRCEHCRSERAGNPRLRAETAARRGYDVHWRRRRLDFLVGHPACALCPQAAVVADHYPLSRRELLTLRVHDPDADEFLRPLCKSCHDHETGERQPGGWWLQTMP